MSDLPDQSASGRYVTDQSSPSEIWAVVPAAGSGTRLPSAYPKQYLQLGDSCILQRAIDTLLAVDAVKGVVVVLSANDSLWHRLPASSHPCVTTTVGGATRAESVTAGLKKVCSQAQDESAMVLVHDAARALTASSDIKRLIERVMVLPEQGGLLANKVQDTLKRSSQSSNADGKTLHTIEATVSRDELWHAQTPQMFRAKLLLDALQNNRQSVLSGEITDEACAMEMSGYKPALVEALAPNFKITHARDLDMALAIVTLLKKGKQE